MMKETLQSDEDIQNMFDRYNSAMKVMIKEHSSSSVDELKKCAKFALSFITEYRAECVEMCDALEKLSQIKSEKHEYVLLQFEKCREELWYTINNTRTNYKAIYLRE